MTGKSDPYARQHGHECMPPARSHYGPRAKIGLIVPSMNGTL